MITELEQNIKVYFHRVNAVLLWILGQKIKEMDW